MTPYIVAYQDKAGQALETVVALAWSHLGACDIAWSKAPDIVDDFQIYGGEEILNMPRLTALAGLRVLNPIGELSRVSKKRRKATAH